LRLPTGFGDVEWFAVTFDLYKQAFSRAAVLAAKNWPVIGSLFVYGVIMLAARLLTLPLGFAGGLIMTLVNAACFSSFLYLVEMIVRTSKVSWEDLGRSFGVYLGDVVGVMFLFWLFSMLAGPVILASPRGDLILTVISLVIFVFFNAVPELIYLGHHSSLALLGESYNFIAANWIEWFPPTLIVGALAYSIYQMPLGGIAAYVQTALFGLVLYFGMVVRGLLFAELASSSRRARAFRYRAGGR
jgi:hypothetical protein